MAAQLESLTVKYDSNVAAGATADSRALEVFDQRATRATKSADAFSKSLSGQALEAAKTAAANRKAEQAQAAYDAELAKGTITAKAHADALQRIAIIREQDIQRAKEQGAALDASFNRQTAATQKLTASTGSASMAMRQLGIQSIDVFQQLASGAPIMTTFIQQGGQITQVAAQGGVSFGTLARGVGSFVAANAGIIATTAAIAGLGLAVYTVGSRASELESQQRTLSVAIQGVGRSAELSTQQLQGYVTELKRQGVAAGDAVAGVAALARNPALSGAMVGRIAALAPDAAAALGVGVPEMMNKLADAAKGTADAIEKLDDAFNLLTPAQAANVRVMVDHGDKAQALDTVFKALTDRVAGLNKEALSPTEQAFRDLGNAWDDFINRIARSEPVLRMVNGLANVLRDANVSDMTGKLAKLQGEASGLQREIDAAGNNKSYLGYLQRSLAANQAEQAGVQGRIDTMLAPRTQGISGQASGNLNIKTGPDDYGPAAPPGYYQAKETDRLAFTRVAGTTDGTVAKLTTELKQYQEQAAQIGARTTENAARFDLYKNAIAATTKAIDDAKKKGEEHRTGLQKYADTLDVQIRTQEELTAAYKAGPEAVIRVTAAQKAQEKAISEGLVPGTAKYRAEVDKTTESLVRLSGATGQAGIAKQVAEIDRATESQLAIMAAYDGTAASITKATNEQRAYTDALKAQLIPGTKEFTDAVSSMSAAYQRSSDAAEAFAQAQRSVQSLMDSLLNTADRLAQGLVDAFLSGQGAAVNFGNVAKAAVASLASELVKTTFLNPVINSITGKGLPTLGSALGVLGGGAGDGTSSGGTGALNIMNQAGNLWSGAGILDTLGLTNIGGWASGIGNSLGLTGSGGLLSGLSGVMGLGINGVSLGSATTSALAALPGGMAGPATSSAVLGQMGGATIGGALAGIGGGFALGNLAGGFTQSAMGKTGYGPMLGAGLGAGAGFLVGGPIGALIGGTLGGAGGGLIGPNLPNAYSSTSVNLSNGQLSLGDTVSQLVDTSQEVANATQQLAQINQYLSQAGVSIASLGSLSQIGQNTPGEPADPTKFADIASAFSQMRFTSEDATKAAALADKSFGSITELAQALQTVADKSAQVTDMLNNVIPALTKAADTRGSIAQQMEAIAQPYNQAFAQIQSLMQAGQTPEVMNQLMAGAQSIVASLDAAYNRAWDAVRKDLDTSDRAMQVRIAQARANVSGDKGQMRDAALMAFDFQAEQQRQAYSDQLTGLFGDAYRATEDYARRIAAQDQATAAERLAVAKQYAEEAVAQDQSIAEEAARQASLRQTATQNVIGVVTSLSDYARSISYGDTSPLSPMSQYEQAQRDFNAVAGAARAGDFNSLSKLPGFGSTLLQTSRAVNGSGIGYANDFGLVQDTIRGVATQSSESLIAAAMQAATKEQTSVLGELLQQLVAKADEQLVILRQESLRPKAA